VKAENFVRIDEDWPPRMKSSGRKGTVIAVSGAGGGLVTIIKCSEEGCGGIERDIPLHRVQNCGNMVVVVVVVAVVMMGMMVATVMLIVVAVVVVVIVVAGPVVMMGVVVAALIGSRDGGDEWQWY